jgi:hypothetical protein
VERKIQANLAVNSWEDRCAAVAIEPELESWVWDDLLRIAKVLKWERQRLKEWLVQEGLLASVIAVKPARPKEAFRNAMQAARQQLSSSVFQDLAGSANVAGCTDPAFRKFLRTLQMWFPPSRQQ